MTNCYNLKNFLNNIENNDNNFFLLYSHELYFINKIKFIIKNNFIKFNFLIKLIFDDINLFNNIKLLILSNIMKQNELIIIEIHNFKFIYFDLISKIFNYKYEFFIKKFLIIIFKINKIIEQTSRFKIFIKKFWFLKLYNLNKNQIENIIKIKLNIINKIAKFLYKFLLNKINNNILIIQEIYKLKIIFYKKILMIKNINKLILNNYSICHNNILIDLMNFNFYKIYKILYFYKTKLDYLIIINNLIINFLNNLIINKKFINYRNKLNFKNEKLKLENFSIKFIKLNFKFKHNLIFENDIYLINKNWLILIDLLIKLFSYFIKLKIIQNI